MWLIKCRRRKLDNPNLSPTYFDKLKTRLSKIKNKNVNLHICLAYQFGMSTLRLQLEMLSLMVYQLRKEGLGRITVKSSSDVEDFTFLFDVQETLFKDHLEQWALTANPYI
jgi:hypothetical protein